jgi:hypothetical protein
MDDVAARTLGRVALTVSSWRMRPELAHLALAGSGRTPTVKNVGEPCAGKPHARFDGEGLEKEPRLPRQSLTLRLVGNFKARL